MKVFLATEKGIFMGGKKNKKETKCMIRFIKPPANENPPPKKKNEEARTSGVLFLPLEIQSSTIQHAQSPAQALALPCPTTHTSAIPVFPHFPSEQRKAFQERVIYSPIITHWGSRGQFSQVFLQNKQKV